MTGMMTTDVAQSVDMSVALVHHTRSLGDDLRDWQVLVEATGYGALLEELYRSVTHHMLKVVRHWASVDVLPTWMEEAADAGRAGYIAAWRERLESDGFFDPKLLDRRESCRQEAQRELLGGSFEILVRLCHAVVASAAPAVVNEVHDAWVKETLQAARPITTPAGHVLGDNVPIGQNAMHAKREMEVHTRLRRLHAKLLVDEPDVLQDRPYHGSVYALPCRARELETESTVRLLLRARDALSGVQTRADEEIAAMKRELVETISELKTERNARLALERTQRREIQNMTSEHNAMMLREAMRVQEEENKAGLHQMELANTLGEMNAAKTRYDTQLALYQEAAAESKEGMEETREALKRSQEKILELRQQVLDAKAERAAAVEAARDADMLRRKVEELESSQVSLGLNVSTVDHVVLNDAAREARRTATREAEIRHAHEIKSLERRCEEYEERIERLVKVADSSSDKSQKIDKLTAEVEAAAAAAMRSKQAQGEAERRAAAAEDEVDQLRSKLRAERETSSSLSEKWSEEVEKLREDNRAMRVKIQTDEAVAGVSGAWECIGSSSSSGGGGGGEGSKVAGEETRPNEKNNAGVVKQVPAIPTVPPRASDLALAARAVMNDKSGDEAARLIARNKELEAATTAMEARERCALERLAEAEAATTTQRDKAGAMLLKAQAAMEAAGTELAAAEARATAAEAAAEEERQRNRVAIKEQTIKLTHEMKIHQQMLAAIHERRLAAMESQISEAAAAREREETARAFREADDRLKTFLNFGHGEKEHVGGTVRLQLEAEVNLAANAMRAVERPAGGGGGHMDAVHDLFRPKGSDAAVAAVVDVAALQAPP